jgi:hypothetical protein
MEENRNRGGAPQQNDEQNTGGNIISEYIVEEKDTLDDIANRYGVSIEEIMAANSETVHDPVDLTRPGQRIMIPNKIRH